MKIEVPDMSCQHCVKRITAALEKVGGVGPINISLEDKLVDVSGTASLDDVMAAIKGAGYSPSVKK
jgi:copper chaperone